MMINDVFQKSVPAAGAAVADTAARYGAIELKSARYLAHKGGSSRTMGSMISGPDRRSVPGPLRYQALVRNAPILTSEPGTGSRLDADPANRLHGRKRSGHRGAALS
jgi:hypothetical protein